MTETTPIDDFAAAKAVYDQLCDLPKDRQERVLRWVTESLGITLISGQAVGAQTAPLMAAGQFHSSPQSGTGVPTEHHHPSGPIPDIRTFVAQKAPASDNQFAAVVAYYYRFVAPDHERKDTIGGAILQEAARLAGRKRLSNPRQTLANARNMGYLDHQGRGEFSINSVGENLVALAMPASTGGGAALANGANSTAARRKRPRAKLSASVRKGKRK